MTMLIAAACVFLGLHLFVSGTRLRDGLVSMIGEGVYLALFSVASLAAIVWLVMAYSAAQAGSDPILYTPWIGIRHLAIPVVALAFLLAVPGLLLPNPTSLKQEGSAAKDGTVRGVVRITRHPFLWGVALWSAFHTAANGDEASTIFFGTFFLLSVLGPFSIDAKRRRKMGAAWEGFAAKTSNVPFAAILRGGRVSSWASCSTGACSSRSWCSWACSSPTPISSASRRSRTAGGRSNALPPAAAPRREAACASRPEGPRKAHGRCRAPG